MDDELEQFALGESAVWRKQKTEQAQRFLDELELTYGKGPFPVVQVYEPLFHEGGAHGQIVHLRLNEKGLVLPFPAMFIKHVRH